jgi:hypothetical protein
MPKYNPNALSAARPHRASVKLVIRDDEGRKQEVETAVFYRGISLDTEFPSVEGLTGKERNEVVKKQLALLVHSIPDFGVGPGEGEQPADEDYFGGMEDAHIDAISAAISDDRDPNAKPSSSSSATTGAEGK